MSKKNNPAQSNAVLEADAQSEADAAKAKRNEASKKAAEKRKNLPVYPGKDLTTVPADYSSSKFQPLAKENFATEADFLDYRADKAEKHAKDLRNQAVDARKLGNVKDVTKAKKLLKIAREVMELKAALAADDVDVEALLRTIGG
jgi:hypothetical protein